VHDKGTTVWFEVARAASRPGDVAA
jgi:hypothetical protein